MSTNTGSADASLVVKRIYVGNLGANVTTEELVHLFGLAATPYLKESCNVEIATCEKTGKSKNFAFITVPEHVNSELLKLNGIEFYGRQLVIEEAKIQSEESKDNNENKENRPRRGPNNYNSYGRRGRGGRQNYGNNRLAGKGRSKTDMPILEEGIMSLIDGGANLTNKKLNPHLDFVIARALASGVKKMVVTGLTKNGCKAAIVMAKTRKDIVYGAVGIHPHFVKYDWNDKVIESLEDCLQDSNEIVAVGECGLDFKKNYSPRDLQETAFKKQVELAVRYRKPLLVHDREAHQTVLDILKEFDSSLPAVVIHCFTGTADQIKAYVERGYYIGVTGFLCKDKYGGPLREAIQDGTLPLRRIVVQSNAPYMVPNTPRNELDSASQTLLEYCSIDNEPCTLSIVVRTIAKCISQDPTEVAGVLTETANKIFRFDKGESSE